MIFVRARRISCRFPKRSQRPRDDTGGAALSFWQASELTSSVMRCYPALEVIGNNHGGNDNRDTWFPAFCAETYASPAGRKEKLNVCGFVHLDASCDTTDPIARAFSLAGSVASSTTACAETEADSGWFTQSLDRRWLFGCAGAIRVVNGVLAVYAWCTGRVRLVYWCRWSDSNRHDFLRSQDFKSCASAISPHRQLTPQLLHTFGRMSATELLWPNQGTRQVHS